MKISKESIEIFTKFTHGSKDREERFNLLCKIKNIMFQVNCTFETNEFGI